MSLTQDKALGQETAQMQYDRAAAVVMRAGIWLSSPAAQLLSPADWNQQFNTYRESLKTLQAMGEQLKGGAL